MMQEGKHLGKPDHRTIDLAFRHLVQDAGRYLPGKLIPVLCNTIGLMIFTRILTPIEYGQYILLSILLGLVMTVAYSWLGSSAFRYYEKHKISGQLSGFIASIFTFHLCTSLLVGLAVTSAYFVMKNIVGEFTIIITAILIGLLWTDSFVELLLNLARAQRKASAYSTASTMQWILKTSFALIGITFLSLRVEGIFGGYLLASIAIVMFFAKKRLSGLGLSIKQVSLPLLRSFLAYGLPVTASALCVMALSVGDRYIIQVLKGPEMVGVYSAGYQIAANAILMPSSLLMLGAFTIIVQTYERGIPGEVESLLGTLTATYIVVGLPLVLMLNLFSASIVAIFLGKEFYGAGKILALIALGQFCLSVAEYFEKSFQLRERTAEIFVLLFVAAVTNVCMNVLLIPVMNEVGAALATFLSYLIYLLLLGIRSQRLLRWSFPYRSLLKSLIAGGICVFVFSWILAITESKESFSFDLFMMGTFLATYFVLLFVIRESVVMRYGRMLWQVAGKH